MHASGMDFFLTALLQGATAVLLRTFDPVAVLDLIEQFRCTSIMGLPAMLQFVVEEQARHSRDISSVRNAGAGGDTVPTALQRRFHDFFGIELREGYALTESVPVTFNRKGDVRIGSIGNGVMIRRVSFGLIGIDAVRMAVSKLPILYYSVLPKRRCAAADAPMPTDFP